MPRWKKEYVTGIIGGLKCLEPVKRQKTNDDDGISCKVPQLFWDPEWWSHPVSAVHLYEHLYGQRVTAVHLYGQREWRSPVISGYVIWVCYLVMLSGYVIWLCYLGMLSGYVIWVCYLVMLSGYVIWVCYLRMLSGYVIWVYYLVILSGYVIWVYVIWVCYLVKLSGYVIWVCYLGMFCLVPYKFKLPRERHFKVCDNIWTENFQHLRLHLHNFVHKINLH